MALHYDPIRIKSLAISSSCAQDIILFRDLHPARPTHLLLPFSGAPLRSRRLCEKGRCTLIPTICVGSVDPAALSTFWMPCERRACHGPLLRPPLPRYPWIFGPFSPGYGDRQSLLTSCGSAPLSAGLVSHIYMLHGRQYVQLADKMLPYFARRWKVFYVRAKGK